MEILWSKKCESPSLQEKGGGAEELSDSSQGVINNIQVSTFESNIDYFLEYLRYQVEGFRAGKISQHYPLWEKLTSDTEVLNTVNGLNIEFTRTPIQLQAPKQKNLNPAEKIIIDNEIIKLLKKGVFEFTN